MGTSYTPHLVGNTPSMDYNVQSNSNNWISFINAVFASIAVLPVFLVWFLGIITDSIEDKENQDERVIIIDENENEEILESKGDTEERHLYVLPNLRNNCNLLEYQEYCTYQDCDNEEPAETIRITTQLNTGTMQDEASISTIKQRTNGARDISGSEPFNWPANDDVIEHLRSFRNKNTNISQDMKDKLSDIGILRQDSATSGDPQGKIVDLARLSGKSCKRKQVHFFWDNFSTKARPGLDSSPDQSPSPVSRKPLKKINLEKFNKWESRLSKNNKHNSTRLL